MTRQTRRRQSPVAVRGRHLGFEALEPRRLLTSYLVDSLEDVVTQDGKITLREAIEAASGNTQVGDAPAGTLGLDKIGFDPSLASGTIQLAWSSRPFLVADDLEIVGLDAGQLTIDGDINGDGTGDTRHFLVNANVTLTMTGLRLVNGYASEGTSGGSIHSDGDLVLSDCLFDANYAGLFGGAIYASESSSSVTLTDSEISNSTAAEDGGGICARLGGTLHIERSLIHKNAAKSGGGIFASRPVEILDNSVVEENAAIYDGGGIWSERDLTVKESVIQQNKASRGGGVYARYASATLTDSDFEENTATGDGGAWMSQWYGFVEISGCNFADNHSDGTGGGIWGLDAARIQDTAFQRNTAGKAGGAVMSWGDLHFISTVFDANSAAWGGAVNSYNGTNTFEYCEFTGNFADYAGAINHKTQTLVVSHSLFENNRAIKTTAGAIRNNAPGLIADTTFRGNLAAGDGGAITAEGDTYTLTVEDCLLQGNEAGTDGSGDGGAIQTTQRRLEVTGTTIRDNSTDDKGGAIHAREGLLVLQDSLIAANVAKTAQGGGIWIGACAEMALANTTVSGNAAGKAGGGIHVDGGTNTVTLVNATVSSNRSDRHGTTNWGGGGIYNNGGHVLLQNTIVAGNFQDTGTDPSDIQGGVEPTSSHDLVGDAASAGGLVDGVNSNRVGVDPLLGPLADNGGKSQTHALLEGSPAIDTADNALTLAPDGEPLWYDQRGYDFDRLVGLHVDMGACEFRQTGGELHGRKWFDLDQDGAPDQQVGGLNIVVNGSFEEDVANQIGAGVGIGVGDSSLTGWQVLAGVNWVGSAWTAAEGLRSIELNAPAAGAIAQTLVTEPRRWYHVQFALAGNPLSDPGLKMLRVTAGDEFQEFTFDTTESTAADMGWQTIDWQFRPQETQTTLKFESLVAAGAGPAIDSVVVQPLNRDDIRIYLDQDGNGAYDDGEPLTFLRPDDPNTPDVDETGTYRFVGLPDEAYSVREILTDGYVQMAPVSPGAHEVTIAGGQTFRDLDFGNRWDGQISGTKFLDVNNNGIRDRNPLPASSPSVLMVIDVSDSSRNSGFAVGDVNQDGKTDTVLDAELSAMLTLRKELSDLGWGGTAQVGIVVFGAEAVQLDMDPVGPGVQLWTTPDADLDGDDKEDVDQILRSISHVHPGTLQGTTDYEAALTASLQTLTTSPPTGAISLFFASDGLANSPWSFEDEVAQLDALGVDRVAWGFGELCDISDLRRIDAFATRLGSAAEILDRATGRSRYGAGDGQWLEPGLPGVTIYLDADGNGQLSGGEPSTLSRADDPATADIDETGWYSFDGLPIGLYTVREIVPTGYVPTVPLNPDEHYVDLRGGPVAAGYDFGNRLPAGRIEGRKGLDADFNGTFEPDEPGQPGVTIYVDLNGNGQHDEGEPFAITDADGYFSIGGLPPREYIVREEAVAGFEQQIPENHDGIAVVVEAGQNVTDLLFVNWDLRACLDGVKWIDLDADGERDPGEPGQDGVRIYLDSNENGQWDANETYTWTREDDPATTDVDETGWWKICGVVPGIYTVREVLPVGYTPGYPGPDGHTVTVLPQSPISGLWFGNIPAEPFIEGHKFVDWNQNGRRDRNRLRGDDPLLVLTVDLSDSVQNSFAGTPPGDVNGDGFANTVLDGELASLIAVNQELILRGLDGKTQVAIVAFGETAAAMDMDPVTPGIQLVTNASADLDNNGTRDVEQVLRSLQRADRTNSVLSHQLRW